MAKAKRASTGGARKRRGRSEDMTGAKDASVETRKVQGALKLPPVTRQLFYYDSLKAEQAKMDTIKSRIQSLNKSAKTEGVDMKSIKDTMAMERGDQAEWRARMEQQARLMKEKGISFQLNVFDVAYGSDVEQAKAEATAAAKAGKGPECRFSEGSEAYDAYMETYSLVQSGMVPGAQDLNDEEKAAAITSGRAERHLELTH